ncbi:hypothetical protein V6N13_129233 [Hibiscus sabdariffa]
MLQYFSIAQNHFQGEIPAQIANLTLLRELDCSHNNFTGTIPQQIGNLKNLEYLSLGVNNLVGPIPPAMFNISTLTVISLLLNQLSGSLPSNMGFWLPNLQALYLGTNQLVGPFPMSISNASQLTLLEMSHNFFSGSIPGSLGNLRNLKKLNLEVNNLTSLGMGFFSSLTNCRDLEDIDFGRNPLVPITLPGLVGNLSNSLQRFSAARCNIRGSIPSEFGNLSSLIGIKLDENELTGMIPATIGGLKELQSLSLSDNKLEGPIPSELCHLNKLSFLILTNNKLSGTIPTCLGNVVSLRQLLLGSNMFSSSIPSTLTGLNGLLLLNLSSNSLNGTLPIDIGKWKVVTNYKEKFLMEDHSETTQWNHFRGMEHCVVQLNFVFQAAKTKPQRNSKARTKLIVYVVVPIVSTILVVALIIIIFRSRMKKETQEDSLPLRRTLATFGYMAPEYGLEGIVSIKGDVYSFGILTMEIIMRKKPTDEMFSEEMSLRSLVKETLPLMRNQVGDTNLLSTTGRKQLVANKCALSVLQVALECSVEIPNERPDMKKVVTKLEKIKVNLLSDIETV